MKLIFLFALMVALAGCTRPADHPINANCQWLEEDNRPLNLQITADRHHLRQDVETAEDVGIRWADKNFHLRPEYEGQREQCIASLFSGVAHQHSVELATVAEYRTHRDTLVDSLVLLSFGALYAGAAYLLAGRMRRRFPEGEAAFWVMIVAIAFGAGLVGGMAGGLWSIVIEEFRLGSGHLSYRMNRIPARQWWLQLYACCVVIFALAALVRSRFRLPAPKKPASLLDLKMRP
jgi:hypothetical protein